MKILLFDIETSPLKVLSWNAQQKGYWNAIKILEDWHMLTFSYKWHGEKTTHVRGLPDYATYKKEPTNDYELVKELSDLFAEADIIIGHNGDQFDIKKTNTRLIYHGITPPPPAKTIDTLKVARKHFKFDSNRLDSLGEFLGVGRKEKTGGIDLWLDCLDGDEKAWKLMKKYNKQDVILLENVYNRLAPWMHNHPNIHLQLVNDTNPQCTNPDCQSHKMQKRGFGRTNTTIHQRYQCQDCGKWGRGANTKVINLDTR